MRSLILEIKILFSPLTLVFVVVYQNGFSLIRLEVFAPLNIFSFAYIIYTALPSIL